MFLFAVYRSLSFKAVALSIGELGFTQGKYASVADIDNPAEILAGMSAVLEPYALSGDEMPVDELTELLGDLADFQEAFDVDLQEEINELSSILD